MRLTVMSIFASPVEQVWAEVQTSRFMLTVIKPPVQFRPLAPSVLPPVWAAGEYRGRMFLLGWIPSGLALCPWLLPVPALAVEAADSGEL